MIMPNTTLFASPIANWVSVTADSVCSMYWDAAMSNMPTPMNAPPMIPMRSAYRVSSGIITTRAIIRGSTRNSIGSIPHVLRASISSLVSMVPRCAANDAPVLPIMMIAVIMGPISRAMDMPTTFAM